MDPVELQKVVDATIEKRRHNELRPHELAASLHRKCFPANTMSIIEPLLHIRDGVTYKYAIAIVGKMKGASNETAWERTWEYGVPQACNEAFRALLRIGNNDERLLAMINKAMAVDNYGIRRVCAETLMKVHGGKANLSKWDDTIPGRCGCDLHKKLAARVAAHLATA